MTMCECVGVSKHKFYFRIKNKTWKDQCQNVRYDFSISVVPSVWLPVVLEMWTCSINVICELVRNTC